MTGQATQGRARFQPVGRRPSSHRGIIALGASFLCATFCGLRPSLGQIGDDVKIGGTSGPNAVQELPVCCYEDPRPPECDGVDCSFCLRTNDPDPCCDPEDPDCVEPPFGEVCCDDAPKHQQEPSIAAAWWDPDILLAVFMDRSRDGDTVSRGSQNAFAVSRDGGATWERFLRDDEFHPDPCSAPDPEFVAGFGRNQEDICFEDWPGGWPGGLGDPCTATAGTGLDAYLYFTGGGVYFARLWLEPNTGEPSLPWEAAPVPGTEGLFAMDKPFVSAEPYGSRLYAHWSAQTPNPTPPPDHVNATFLTVSCDHGEEFFGDQPGGCEADGLDGGAGIQLSYLNTADVGPPGNWGTASAVGPNGEVHFIWPVLDYVDDGVDQMFVRTLRWDEGQTASFEPPLGQPEHCYAHDPCYDPQISCCDPRHPCFDPETPCCDPDDPCEYDPVEAPLCSCEVPIIHDQPGFDGPGYGRIIGRLVSGSTNIGAINHPSIAVDQIDPDNLCGFGGSIYVAYAAEEPDKEYEEPYEDYVFVDSNIYVVRSRDGGSTWSEPLLIDTHAVPEWARERECENPACPSTYQQKSFRRPLQFYSWIAVDKQGRVGLMWHDTHPDFPGGHPNADPCDGNLIYQIHFAWSLDGGVSWLYGWEISDEVSQTGVGTPVSWEECGTGIKLGEYSGLTATSNERDEGIFHAIWTDFREYRTPWRQEDTDPGDPVKAPFMGDIYTTKVLVDDPVYSMGDFDRDYDVDMDDFAYFDDCAVTPLPPECEILDMNRNNVIDNEDPLLFMNTCFTGRGGGGDGGDPPPESGDSDSDEEVCDPLDETVAWCLSVMSADERSALADSVRMGAESTDAEEAARMITFADAIDPQP